MKNNDFFKRFTNQYPLSKTLRFELVPQGKTRENIENRGLLSADQQRADSYLEMKKTIDEYHKYFIELALKEVRLSKLTEYLALYSNSKDTRDEVAFSNVKEDLRKEIVKAFSNGKAKERYKNLFSKELIKDDLEQWIKTEGRENQYFDEKFKNFTTYFTGFHENRKNMYSADLHSTAIAYRIIHENLPKFIENIQLYKLIQEKHPQLDFSPILTEMEALIQGRSLNEIFTLDFFNEVLTQRGIEFINFIIGGQTLENGIKIKGLNEYINLYNQQQTDKRNRVPRFKQLYKQILCDRSNISYLPDAFKSDNELLDAIENYFEAQLCSFINEDGVVKNILSEVNVLMKNITSFDISKIYLRNDTNITTLSQRIFGDYSIVGNAINHYYENVIDPKFEASYNNAKDRKKEALDTKKNKFTHQAYLSIADVQLALDGYIPATFENAHEVLMAYTPTVIADYFHTHFKARDIENNETNFDLVSHIYAQYNGVKGLLNIAKTDCKELAQDKEKVHQLKTFLDSILELLHFVRPLHLVTEAILEKDNIFYDQFTPLYGQLSQLTPLYNMVRNYLTQKPYSTEKIKLNFENAELLGGWDENKESAYLNVILRKQGLYYLAIMEKKSNNIFENAPIAKEGCPSYDKMVYKLLPGVNKMLPKVFFAKSNIAYFNPSTEVLRVRNEASHSKNGAPQDGFKKADFNLKDCHLLIDFFKESLQKHEDWKKFNFHFSETSIYEDISGFYREVEAQGYKLTFDKIPVDFIDKMVDEGKLYLFQLYNKDFSSHSKGKPNMHTLYWKALFDEQNLANVVYKLNGQAEIFFRKASIQAKNIVTHKANVAIKAKNPLTPDNNNVFSYDVIKDRRFTVDKFHFHVPITLNFKATGGEVINNDVNEFLRNNPDVKIIGLDRGERHLIYLTLIDQQGNIIIQESLNTIEDLKHNIATSYHSLLDKKEKGRDTARREWGTIETIKELKEGYISQVVHKIACMMVEHNAIVVMEDLNFGFKRGRFKLEKQIYQKLEKMLIDKLNYLVFKEDETTAPGGLLNALQLTNKFESFKKMGKQSGFLFYVPAWNTSKIDPVTGFVDFLKPKYESVEQAKSFFSKFSSIKYNLEKGYFEFVFDYSEFGNKAEGTRTKWTVCTAGGERYYYQPKDKTTQKINVTEQLKELFDAAGIAYDNDTNLKENVVRLNEKDFWVKLTKYLSIVLALRYSNAAEDRDFILSPVADVNGNFYNSETGDDKLPKDADANGAYHIALKGLWVLEQLENQKDEKKPNLAISNKQWLQYVQLKPYKTSTNARP